MMGLYLANDGTWMQTVKIDSSGNNWYYEAMLWCQANCTSEYRIMPWKIGFENNKDAVFYALSHK